MSTWGDIRYRLAKEFPGLDVTVLSGWMQDVYRDILAHRRWKGLEKDGTISTTARYLTGTVAVTNGSTAITGTSTVWTSAMTGREIRIGGRNELYGFTFLSTTTGTLGRNYEGDTDTGLSYEILQRFYDLAADVGQVVDNLLDPESARPVVRTTQGELDSDAPHRPAAGDPFLWAPAPDSAEVTTAADPAVLHRVELYPIPTKAEALPYRYRKLVTGFVFSAGAWNTGGEPLPWIDDTVIMAGVRTFARAHEKDYTGSIAATNDFTRLKNQLSDGESRRVGPIQISMDSRYTRHRQNRLR